MKKTLRILSMVLTIAMTVTMLMSVVFAIPSDLGFEGPNTSEGAGKSLKGAVETVLGFIAFIAWAVALGMIVFIGIKYMTKGAGGKAEVKSTFLPYVVGAVCVGAASTIASFIMGLGAGTTAGE